MVDQRVIKVSNIAPDVLELSIRDFFSYCGQIVNIQMSQNPSNDGQEAIIEFETILAAQTSLLLSNAVIGDRCIIVQLIEPKDFAEYINQHSSVTIEPNTLEEDKIKDSELPYEIPAQVATLSATGVIAELIASGHRLSDTAISKAKIFDEQYNLSNKVNQSVLEAKNRLNELDQRLGISHRASSLSDLAMGTVKQLDAKCLNIGDESSPLRSGMDAIWTDLSSTASQTWQSALDRSSSWFKRNAPQTLSAIEEQKGLIQKAVNQIQEEANRIYPGVVQVKEGEKIREEGGDQSAMPLNLEQVDEITHQDLNQIVA